MNKQETPEGDCPPTNCSAVEIKDWTAKDAMGGAVIVSEDGRLWQIEGVGFGGHVHVTASEIIKPQDRHHWKLFKPNVQGHPCRAADGIQIDGLSASDAPSCSGLPD